MTTVRDLEVLALVAEILVWIGTTLILDACWRREKRRELAKRLRPLLRAAHLGSDGRSFT
jgi:hypothetical protein